MTTTDAWGVDDGYWTVGGEWVPTPAEVARELRWAMGASVDDAPGGGDGPPGGPPLWFVRAGSAPPIDRPALLRLEDGTEVDAAGALPADLPLGYHELHPSDGGPVTRLVVTPARAAAPPARTAALAVQLYAARSTASWGIGDLADAAGIARWAAGLGIGALLLSPLHAPMPTAHQEPSPYFASSRCFRNPLHLRIEAVPGFDRDSPALQALASTGRALGADPLLHRNAVWAAKRAALEHIWERRGAEQSRRDAACARWQADHEPLLGRYATFCALADHHGRGWHDWPEEHRHPDHPGVARFAADAADAVAFHRWVQWLCERQLAGAAAAGTDLVLDLAVGTAPDGADAWLWQDVLAPGVRVGAPPDAFNAAGQDWGLPPFVPWKLRAAGYEPFRQMLRSAFEHSAGLRVDHVMGLFRLWWVPRDHGPDAGGYVRHRDHDLLDVLALESVRAGAYVVGEDLGTVEDDVRAALGARGVLSYRVAWFEDRPPSEWPEQALASATTHDLPTVAGVWHGTDDPDGSFRPRLDALVGAGPGVGIEGASIEGTDDQGIAARVAAALATAPCEVVSMTLEDVLGVAERPNVPGTTTEHPNWRRTLPVPVDRLGDDAGAATVLQALRSPTAAQPDDID